MFRVPSLSVIMAAFSLACGLYGQPAVADTPPSMTEPKACDVQPDDPTIRASEKTTWTDCEKWAWACVRQGLEANLFTKQCTVPRTSAHTLGRQQWQLAPFLDPKRFAATNALSARFVETILTVADYRNAIPAIGVRLFGGYFAEPVNLENLVVTTNLVLDGAMILRGLRLTNFRTDKNLSLDGSNIRGSLYLMRARVDGSIYMEFGAYDTVDLRDARIGASLEGTGSVFNSDLRFDRARIEGKLVLIKARLTMVRGALSHIGGSLDMRVADIRLGLDLSGATIAGDVRMPEVTFGRHPTAASAYCDWNPDADTDNLLNRISKSTASSSTESRQVIAEALREVVETRPTIGGNKAYNSCEAASDVGALAELSAALLRNMRIDGTLCLVDMTGEIAGAKDPSTPFGIETISLDGTTAKSTIIRWKKSNSRTLWHAVDFKTNHMLVNLENRPRVSYFDNLEVGALTFISRDATEQIVSKATGPDRDEELLKTKCDVTPVATNTEPLDNHEAQDHIIDFFATNTSRSMQPFAQFVSRLQATGLDTTRLKIGLSELQYRNSCSTSELTTAWRTKDWSSFLTQAGASRAQEFYRLTLDSICSVGYSGFKYSVAYGHRPLNLVLWALGIVALLYLTLWFDRPDPMTNGTRKHPGLVYVIDNLIPLKPYRIDRDKAEQKPQSGWLKVHLAAHRGLGVLLAVLAFFFIYKAST